MTPENKQQSLPFVPEPLMITDLTNDLDIVPENTEPDNLSIGYRKYPAKERNHPEKFLKKSINRKLPRQQVEDHMRNVRAKRDG